MTDPARLAQLTAEFLEARKDALISFLRENGEAGPERLAGEMIGKEKRDAATLELLKRLKASP